MACSIIRKMSKASSWCIYMLNYAVDSFGECVSYPVFGMGKTDIDLQCLNFV